MIDACAQLEGAGGDGDDGGVDRNDIAGAAALHISVRCVRAGRGAGVRVVLEVGGGGWENVGTRPREERERG